VIEPNIATIASLVVAVVLIAMFSRMLRFSLVIAIAGAVIWAVQSGAGLEQGAGMLASLSQQVQEQLGGLIDIDSAVSAIREMLDRVTG